MEKSNILQKDYTLNQNGYQLKLPLNIDCIIPKDDSVRLLSQFVEEMDLSDLYSTYQRIPENPSPRTILKVVLYAYMNGDFSSRDMEKDCRRDINFMYLLEGAPVPDHATFARFHTLHFALCSKKILAAVTKFLYSIGEISGEDIFIDGTKIEAYANKYTFVWKKATTKNMEKLLKKLAAFVESCEEMYGLRIVYQNKVTVKHLKKLRKRLYRLKAEEGIEFVHGTGKRKSPLQKSIETLEQYLDKLKEYTQKLYVCGDRNSYSKTDHDATFMRMKEDAMGNGQLKAGYNIQHGVDSEYITWLTVGPQPTDTTTLIPFLKELEEYIDDFKYQRVTADAGYESEENYAYLEKEKKEAFIKPANYEIGKKRSYQNDIGRAENMNYDSQSDTYTCHNGKRLKVSKIKKEKTKTGYERETTIYSCEDCSGCPYKKECIKGNHSKVPFEDRTKNLYVSRKFNQYRKDDLERIRSEEGILLRVNRSIQSEGSFGDLKEDTGFRRFRYRGKANVEAQSILLAIAHNIRKLHQKIQSGKTGTHLFALKKSA